MQLETEILTTYSWLTKDLFTDIIRKDLDDNSVNVLNFITKFALPPGENYTSTMIRVTVNYESYDNHVNGQTHQKHFIIKAAHIKTEVRDLLDEMNLFEKEITMYRDILPKVEQMLADIGDNRKLAPKCYKVSDIDNEQYLIFEDLAFKGYKNVDRRIGLNIPHFKKALSKIAKWHATTAVLLELTNYKDYPKILNYESLFKTESLKQLTKNALKAAAEITKSMPEFQHLSSRLLETIPKIFEATSHHLKEENSNFFTLCHGDLWMNNILFRYDENETEPCDAILVDYQGPFRGPAIMDVINALYTSSDDTLQDREWDVLIQHYHKERTETLKKLGYKNPIPSLTDTHKEFLEKGLIIFGMALLSSGVRVMENTGQDGMTFVCDDEESYRANVKIMSNPKSQKCFRFLLDYFDRKGYIDLL